MEATTDSGVYYWKSEDIDKKEYIMAFDIGTTGCRTILFDRKGNIAGSSYKEFPQIYPKPGWVEHDAEVIWKTQMEMTAKVLVEMGISAAEVAGIGITNQRETTVVWNRHTCKPVMNAIVWQDKRTSDISDGLVKMGLTDYISENTGLRPDSYFSGTKIKWILDNVEGARESANNGDLLFGTIDCWMIWKLTGGKSHVTDYSNASRTLLFNIRKLCWDDTMLKALDITNIKSTIQQHKLHYKDSKGKCTIHYIRNVVLEKLVLEAVNSLADFVRCYESVFLCLMAEKSKSSKKSEKAKLMTTVENSRRRISEIDMIISRIYEDNILGKLSDERYSRMASGYETEQRNLIAIAEKSETRLHEIEQSTTDMRMLLDTLREITGIKELNRSIVNKLIRRIEVHKNDKYDGHCHVQVDIYFTAVGMIDVPSAKEIGRIMEKIRKDPRKYVTVA